MTAAERRERGTLLCRQLTDKVTEMVPPGVGRWERAWDIVGDADAEFMVALTRWEATGSETDEPALRAAYYGVLRAWKRAVVEFEREGAGR